MLDEVKQWNVFYRTISHSPKKLNKKVWTTGTYIIYQIFIKWHRHQWKIQSSSLDFTFLWGQNWCTSKFVWHSCFPLFPLPHLSARPSLIEGIRNTHLFPSSLDTRFIVKIILVNICTEENKRALTRPLRFLHYKL